MTGGNLKTSIVKRADNFITNQQSLGKIESKMRTFALSWIDFSFITNDKNSVLIIWTNFKFSNFSFLKIIFSLDSQKVSVVDFSGGEP